MKLNMDQYVGLASVIKQAAEPKRPQPPQLRQHSGRPEFIDYSKSLAAQGKTSPIVSGIQGGIGTGALAAILSALAARIMSDNPYVVGGSAAAGGTLGAMAGYRAGKNQSLSDYSRLLFLRRLGINRPGELEVLNKYGPISPDVIEEGTVI